MLTFFFRGVLTILCVLYTVITIGIQYSSIASATKAPLVLEEDILIPESKNANITVNVLKIGTNSELELSKVYELYNNNTINDVKFLVQTVNETDYSLILRSKLLAGEKIDLFNISGRRELDLLKDYVSDLDEMEWVRKAYVSSLEAVTIENHVYGVPYSLISTGLICNQEIFDWANISISQINSLEDLDNAFSKLNEKINSGESSKLFPDLEAVTEFPALDKNFLEKYFSDIAMSNTFKSVSEAALSKDIIISEQTSIEELLKVMIRYSSSNSDWKKMMEITNTMQLESFANYRLAAILQDTNVYSQINDINPEIKGRCTLLPIPLKDFETPVIYVGVPFYWAINSSTGEVEAKALADFLEWLYLSKDGSEYFARELGDVSPFRDTAVDTGVVLHGQMLNYLAADMYLPQIHREFPQNWGKNVFAANVQDYITQREKTWADVVESCEKEWNDYR